MIFKPRRIAATAHRSLLNELGFHALKTSLRTMSRLFWGLSLADVKELPHEGAFIIAPNHRSYLDPLVVGACFERRVNFMMTSKYYDLWYLNWFFRTARCIVVEDGGDNRTALREGKKILEAGQVLVIFPEGHISPDGELKQGEQGVAWLARKTGAPVMPVWVGGTREAHRKGEWRLRSSRITVRTGELMRIDDYPAGRPGTEAFTDDLMDAIAALGAIDAGR